MVVASRRTVLVGATTLALLRPSGARAASHEVEMLNAHPDNSKQRMVFHPRLLVIEPGDTVTFVPTHKSHNSVSIDGMIPEGAATWKGRINDPVEVTLDQPGFYGYECFPHRTMGMVGLIIVEGDGKLDNLEAAQAVKHRGRAKKIFEEIWQEAEAGGLLS
ncbi:MAG: pseudoazurin [Pseudomonadota bacterium]